MSFIKVYASTDYVDEKIDEVVEQVEESILPSALTDVIKKTPQELTLEEINQVRENIHSVGQHTAGLTYYPFNVTEVISYEEFTKELLDPVVAKQGAEIYNDYENNIATGMWAVARGCGNQALGDFSDASGWLTKATAFCSISSGRQTEALAPYSHAEGHNTKATANDSHAEGEGSQALNARAHAEGYYTTAKANQAHSEGMLTVASGINSHAEGWATTASGQNAFAGGKNTKASGTNSFANGLNTIAKGAQQVVHGKYNIEDTTSLMIIGNGTSDTARSNAYTLDAKGNAYFAGKVTADGVPENDNDLINKKYAEENFAKLSETGNVVIEGEIQADNVPHIVSEVTLLTIPASTIQEAINNGTKNITVDSFTHDSSIIVYANYGGKEYASFTNEDNYIEFFIADPYVTDGFACSVTIGVDADGNEDSSKARFNYRVLDSENVTDLVLTQLVVSTIDSKYFDHDFTIINSISMNRRGDIGVYSTALGGSCVATGHSSLANGLACEATGAYSTALGKGTFASGEAGLSTGLMTTAGREAFASGRQTKATGRGSLATGNTTVASGSYSHAEGQNTTASKTCSHVEGINTLASSNYQHVQGKYNIEDTADKYAHIVGNGTSTSARSNAHTLDWSGNAEFAGDVIANGCGGSEPISLTGLNETVTNLNNTVNELQTSLIITKQYTQEYIVDTKESINVAFTIDAIEGYTQFSIVGFSSGDNSCVVNGANTNSLDVYNISDSEIVATASITVSYIKNQFLG